MPSAYTGVVLGRDKVDKLVEAAFETLEEENGDTALVGTVLLVCEVRTDYDSTAFYTFSNDKRQWIQRALITEAQEAILLGEVEEK
jgi:hypothetical protein